MSNSSKSVGKWLVPFLSLSVFVMAAGSAAASTYYVSNSGNDPADCSHTVPWKTIAKVQMCLGSLQPGDSVLFERGGIWYEQLDLNNVNGTASQRITFGNYGSGNLPIIDGGGTVGTVPPGHPNSGGPGIVGTGVRPWCIGAFSTKASYLTVDGFECRYTSNYGIAFETSVAGSYGITVQNSYIHDTGDGDYGYHNQLEYFDWTQNPASGGAKFLNNKVGNCYAHNCIMIDGDLRGGVIQGNECYGWSHNCIDVKRCQGTVVDGNVVHDGLGNEIYGEAYYIEQNRDITTPGWTADVTWTRNVAYGSIKSAAFQCQDAGGPVTCRVYNNTVYSNANGVMIGHDPNQSNTLNAYVENNIFDTPTPQNSDGSGYSVWDYNDNVHSSKIGTNDQSVDPQYVNAAAHDFHLQPTSPVIDKGTNVGLPYNGSAPDMGAFEYGGAPPPVAWYKLDETSVTTALDSSGNGNNSSFVQGTSIVPGKINNARSFNAATSDYINIPTSPSLSGLNQFTVAFWIKTYSLNGTAQTALFDKGDYQISGVQILDDGPYSGLVVCRTNYAGGSNDVSIPRISINDDAWHHLACTFDGVTKTFYLDGNALSTGGVSGYVSADNYDLHLGTPWNSRSSAVVIEDDVRIYNRALNATEIQALVNP